MQHIYTNFLLRKLWPPFQNTKQSYFGVEQCNLFELFKSKSNTCKVYHVKTRPFLRYNFICSIGKRNLTVPSLGTNATSNENAKSVRFATLPLVNSFSSDLRVPSSLSSWHQLFNRQITLSTRPQLFKRWITLCIDRSLSTE